MRELSVFVDESGDFGEYDYRSPYYIVTLLFHDQTKDISEEVFRLGKSLKDMGFEGICVHAGPIIRSENEYRNIDLATRQRVFKRMMSFIRHADIQHYSVYIEKKHIQDTIEAAGKLSRKMAHFIRAHLETFYSYDKVKIYYDNGQVEVTRILSSVFNAFFDHVEFKKVFPKDYRLFQAVDMICTLKLVELKADNKTLSNSEMNFFDNERVLKKNYLKPMKDKEMP